MGHSKNPKQLLLVKWHRRLGFLITGMLLVFAISGIALNHQSHWDPYYTIHKSRETVVGLSPSMSNNELDLLLRNRYGVEAELDSSLWESSRHVTMSYANGISFTIDLKGNSVVREVTSKRPGIYKLIHLHLNGIKGLWILAADFFAVGLILLSLSGIYLVKGKFNRNEYAFLMAGILMPFFFYVFL